MTMTTSAGKTYNIKWAFAPTMYGEMMFEMEDDRKLSEIAAEFEGIDRFERKSSGQKDEVYEGYTILSAIHRDHRAGTVQLSFVKG